MEGEQQRREEGQKESNLTQQLDCTVHLNASSPSREPIRVQEDASGSFGLFEGRSVTPTLIALSLGEVNRVLVYF